MMNDLSAPVAGTVAPSLAAPQDAMANPPVRRKPSWKWLWLVLVLVLVLIAVVRWWRGPIVEVEQVVRRDFVQTVVASGRVESPHRVSIGAQITGTVIRVPVAEGQRVKAGDLLVELAETELKATERQAEVAVLEAEARLRQLKEVQAPSAEQTLRQARATLDNAAATVRRNDELFKKGFLSEAALDDSRKALALADAQWRMVEKQ